MVWNTIVNQTQNFDPLYRGILRIGSTPKSSIVFFGLIFHEINYPAIGVPKFMETPIYQMGQWWFSIAIIAT